MDQHEPVRPFRRPRRSPRRRGSYRRIYTYIRSDRDSAEAETIHVFRESWTHIGVARMRGRCTNAAYVTADLDLERGYATRLGGGRLRPDAQREEFAVLTYDATARRLNGRVETTNGPPSATTAAVPCASKPVARPSALAAGRSGSTPERAYHRGVLGHSQSQRAPRFSSAPDLGQRRLRGGWRRLLSAHYEGWPAQ